MYEEEITINILNNNINLDVECWKCYRESGKKKFQINPNPDCNICEGKGFILTATGEAIVDLVKRHFKGE